MDALEDVTGNGPGRRVRAGGRRQRASLRVEVEDLKLRGLLQELRLQRLGVDVGKTPQELTLALVAARHNLDAARAELRAAYGAYGLRLNRREVRGMTRFLVVLDRPRCGAGRAGERAHRVHAHRNASRVRARSPGRPGRSSEDEVVRAHSGAAW